MKNATKRLVRGGLPAGILALVLASAGSVKGQANGSGPIEASAKSDGATVENEYRIGRGDVISVLIVDAPELGGRFRVSETGMLEIPAIPKRINAEDQTAEQLAHTIRQALLDAKQLRDPKVSVFVEQFHGRTITVIGSVMKPSVYPLERRTTVVEALSLAGGLQPTAGNIVTIVRGAASAEATNTAVGSVQILDMSKLVKGEDPGANIEVRTGDVISVSNAALVYVVGAVTKPGGYVMLDPGSGMSVTQAVATAQGFTPIAASHRGLIVRQSTSTIAHEEIPVDILAMMRGQIQDVHLAPNDILYVPESGTKKTLKAMGDFAMAAASGIAVYGIGYRVAGIKP
ncbi:MAG: polysaccharide biosynthesis/export family protein [Candidatus Acidiferrales bacterium]